MNDELKKGLRKIVESNDADVYGVYRYPLDERGERKNVRTLQIRLFNRKFIEETGIIHQLPIVKGRYTILDNKYYIMHMHKQIGRENEYSKLEIFNRYSWCTVPPKFRRIARLIHPMENIDCDREITNSDYLLLFFLGEAYSSLITRDLRRLILSPVTSIEKMNRIMEYRNAPDSEENFQISKIIRETGMIKFLELEDEYTINYINSQCGDLKGADLLIKLLKERYRNMQKSVNDPSIFE